MERQSSVCQVAQKMTGLCIVALPREYRTCEEVKNLVENVLKIGQVFSVHLAETLAKTGIVYNTANLVMREITNSDVQHELDVWEGRTQVPVPEGMAMTWDNGKRMQHLSIRQLPEIDRFEFCSSQEKIVFPDGACPSLHIPIIPRNLMRYSSLTGTFYNMPKEGFYDTETGLTDLIQNKICLGQVKRIDFVVRDDKEDKPKAAFIHFDHWYDNKNSRFLLAKLQESGSFRQKGYYDGFTMQQFCSRTGANLPEAFFVFKINHRPIPEVDEATCELNIHQLVASNKRLLESEAALLEQVAALTKRIAELENKQDVDTPPCNNEEAESEMSEEKQDLGERIFHYVAETYPMLAAKITGMILELSVPDIVALLEDPTFAALDARIQEALRVLGIDR